MKNLFLLPAVALLVMSCSNEPLVGTPSNKVVSDGGTDYLYVAITNPGGATRASDNNNGGHDIGTEDGQYNDGDFLNGSEDESEVSAVRFFFFHSSGNPAIVNTLELNGTDTQVSYLDWDKYNATTSYPNDQTIEAAYKGLLRLKTPSGLEKPTQVIAVVNPTADVKALNNPTMRQLTTVVHNYAPSTDPAYSADGSYSCAVNKQFLMSNSVWVDTNNNNEVMLATTIDPVTQMFSKEEAALANPVIIYVERVAARIDLSIWATQVEDKCGLEGFVFDTGYKVNETNPIYVQFKNWGVTSTPTNSYLVKNVNAEWTTQSLFDYSNNSDPDNVVNNKYEYQWTVPSLHRSFWAYDPTQPSNDYKGYNFLSYDQVNKALPSLGSDDNTYSKSTLYTQEHASPTSAGGATELPTDVIIIGKLWEIVTNDDGTKTAQELYLADWNHVRMSPDAVLEAIAGKLPLYSNGHENATDDELAGAHITASDLTFETQLDFSGENAILKPGGYYVYVTLSETGKNKIWYDRSVIAEGSTSGQPYNSYKTPEEVAQFIATQNFGDIMVWKAGMTYYYFPIQHLGAEGSVGYYGVVRNHIYQAQVSSIFGLGTPVWDPNEPIVPEKPSGDNNLMAAQINILQWRLVSQSYNLEW